MKRFLEKRKKNTTVDTSYAIVTNEIDQFEGWHERSLIWETARPYLYFRTYRNRIIVGGLDEALQIQTIGDTKLLHKRDILINIVKEMFPQYKIYRQTTIGQPRLVVLMMVSPF